MPISPIKTAIFLLTAITIQWPLNCFAGKEEKATRKISRLFEKIHTIDNKLSFHSNDSLLKEQSAVRMMDIVSALAKEYPHLSDTAALKIPLQEFLSKWNNKDKILTSLLNNDQKFMADVTGFYLRGLVTRKKDGKTLFPLYRP